MNPTICKACGQRIETPDGRLWCEACQERVYALPLRRPDDSDLTPLVRSLSQSERDEHEGLKWQARGCWCFWGLALAAAAIMIWWGIKQLE